MSHGVNGDFGGPPRSLQGLCVAFVYCLRLVRLGCPKVSMEISVALLIVACKAAL